MEKANSGMWMGTFMKANEKMIKPMVRESTIIAMAPSTRELGRMIFNMALALKHEMMVPGMKASFPWEKKKGRAPMSGMMPLNIKEVGAIIKSLDMYSY